MKDLINIIELVIIAQFAWKAARFILFGRKKHKKTLLGKIWLLISRQLHGIIDGKLREQNKRLAKSTRQADEKVVQFAKYKRRIN